MGRDASAVVGGSERMSTRTPLALGAPTEFMAVLDSGFHRRSDDRVGPFLVMVETGLLVQMLHQRKVFLLAVLVIVELLVLGGVLPIEGGVLPRGSGREGTSNNGLLPVVFRVQDKVDFLEVIKGKFKAFLVVCLLAFIVVLKKEL